jgi:ferredoxin
VLAPAVFEVDDDGVLAVLREPAEDELPDVRDAVQACPTRALALAD